MNCEPTLPFTLVFIFKYNEGYRKQLLRQSMFKFKEVTSDAVSICTFCPFFFQIWAALWLGQNATIT